MKKVYFCHTVYHLLITLCKISVEEQVEIIVFDTVSNHELIVQKIRDVFVNTTVLFAEQNTDFSILEIDRATDIYVFNDWTPIGAYLRKNKLFYHLIEDGYNYHEYNVYANALTMKRRLLNFVLRREEPSGFSRYVRSIEVNRVKYLPNDCRKSKWVEKPRSALFENLVPEHKQKIITIFGLENYQDSLRGVLVLTQPLVQDYWDRDITTEEEQLEFYRQIVESYGEGEQVFFKIHPRDKVDYSSLTNVIFLKKNVPMEVYELIADCHFTKGITHSSTALDFLSCVDKKITLKQMKANS
ncbi:glycosyltransferase family 52 [Streptococcus entericus]|uniref:glycosyltransferase family 52 n=1 Tax=Streptococcus entericus TaxID=155680 RepID=UPI000363B79E|nr:glycosyltransferase family 52 [Streptococcus entericus]